MKRVIQSVAAAGLIMWAVCAGAGDEIAVQATVNWEAFVNSNLVTSLWLEGSSVIWGSQGGVVFYSPGDSTFVKLTKTVGGLGDNSVNAVAVSPAGLWIGTTSAGVNIYDDGAWAFEGTRNFHLLSNEVLDIAVEGTSVAVGTTSGLSLFLGGQFTKFFNGNDWAHSGCDAVLAVSLGGGEAVIGTECGGFAYSPASGTWRQVVSSRRTSRISYDGEKLFWILAGDSIYTYDGSATRLVPKTLVDFDVIRDIGASDSSVWIVGNNGPARYNFGEHRWKRFKSGIPFKFGRPGVLIDLLRVRVGADGPWIGTQDGVASLRDTTWVMVKSPGPASNFIQDLCIDGTGDLWFTTGSRVSGEGVLRYSPATFAWQQYRPPVVGSDLAYVCETNPVDGTVWFGFWEGVGLWQYDPQHSVWSSHTAGLHNLRIPSIYADSQGNVVFAQYQYGVGLRALDGQLFNYAKGDSGVCMEGNCITAVGPGPAGAYMIGNYYIGPNEGCEPEVVRLKLRQDHSVLRPCGCTKWGPSDGWPQGIATYAFAVEPSGVVWLGSDGGLGSLDPECGSLDPECGRRGTWHYASRGNPIGVVWDVKVDSQGNKWVASDGGLYVLKGPGLEWGDFREIEIYNATNSPLAAVPVKAVQFDADGAVWIGTAGGGVYRFERPRLGPGKKTWINVFPNPYVESKDTCGEGIGFAGFQPGSTVRVYSLAGDLVKEVDPDARWDTANAAGRKVVSGIYIYVGRTEDGHDFKGKLVIVR